jgi:hypothetical protein
MQKRQILQKRFALKKTISQQFQGSDIYMFIADIRNRKVNGLSGALFGYKIGYTVPLIHLPLTYNR